MFELNVDLIPAPADTSLYKEGVQYLVVDNNGIYHIANWDSEEETLVIPDMVESIEIAADVQVDPGHVADSPVPVVGSQQPEGVGSNCTDTPEQADEDDEETLYVSFVAALPEFVAPHQL
jgi:hypothetical protein